MFPIWVAAIFFAVSTLYVGQNAMRQQSVSAHVAADVSAANFLAYRQAVRSYVAANPGATGVIADAALGPYWLPGYIRQVQWTNLVQDGTLYVYSITMVNSGTLAQLRVRSSESLLLGTKGPAGRLRSSGGVDTGVVLPAAIANGAVVMMGL